MSGPIRILTGAAASLALGALGVMSQAQAEAPSSMMDDKVVSQAASVDTDSDDTLIVIPSYEPPVLVTTIMQGIEALKAAKDQSPLYDNETGFYFNLKNDDYAAFLSVAEGLNVGLQHRSYDFGSQKGGYDKIQKTEIGAFERGQVTIEESEVFLGIDAPETGVKDDSTGRFFGVRHGIDLSKTDAPHLVLVGYAGLSPDGQVVSGGTAERYHFKAAENTDSPVITRITESIGVFATDSVQRVDAGYERLLTRNQLQENERQTGIELRASARQDESGIDTGVSAGASLYQGFARDKSSLLPDVVGGELHLSNSLREGFNAKGLVFVGYDLADMMPKNKDPALGSPIDTLMKEFNQTTIGLLVEQDLTGQNQRTTVSLAIRHRMGPTS